MNLVLALVLAQLAGAPAYPAPPVASPPPAATVGVPVVLQPTPVRFAAPAGGEPYSVLAEPPRQLAAFQAPQSCQAPCELRLVPGRYRLTVGGAASFRQRVHVFGQPTELHLERRDEGWRRLAITSVSVGGGLAVAGVFTSMFTALIGAGETEPGADSHWARRRNLFWGGLGVAALGGAIAGIGGGIGFSRMGHTRLAPRKAPGVELVGVAMGPTEGRGAQVGAAFRF